MSTTTRKRTTPRAKTTTTAAIPDTPTTATATAGDVYEVQVHREPLSTGRVVVVASVHDADATHLGTTQATSLRLLDKAVREVVVLGADLPDEAEDTVVLRWVHDDADLAATYQVATDAARLRTLAATRASDLHAVVRRLAADGYTVRDVAVRTGLSTARAGQLTRTPQPAPTDLLRANADA